MQQGYREWKPAGCINLRRNLRGKQGTLSHRFELRPTRGKPRRGIAINTFFEAAIEPDKGYHPYQLLGPVFDPFVRIYQGSLPAVREGK